MAPKAQSSPPLQSKGFVAQRQEDIGHPRKKLFTRGGGLGAAGYRALSHLPKALSPSQAPQRERKEVCYNQGSSTAVDGALGALTAGKVDRDSAQPYRHFENAFLTLSPSLAM